MASRSKALIASVMLIAATGLSSYLVLRSHGAEGVPSRSGNLMRLVQRLVEEMPRPNSGAYDRPTATQERLMSEAFRSIEEGRLDEAASVVRPLDYEVVRYTDTATGRNVVLLQERQRPDGSWPHAWGLYVADPDSGSHLVVEVAHPLDDIDTWIVGVDTFRRADASALLVAGASRYAAEEGAADVAHETGTVFEAIHRAALSSQPSMVVFQPHGFETAEHAGYGDIVVSTGTSSPDALARSVAAALRERGFAVCLYDGEHCSALGATTNVQGQTILPGDHFLHVEMSHAVRIDRARSEVVAEVVARVAG